METIPIRSVEIKFLDGTIKTILIIDEEIGTAYYKKEDFNGQFLTHSVFIVGGLERDMPSF